MNDRKSFRWTAQLQTDQGQIVERDVVTYWSPDKDFVTGESIAAAAAGMEYVAMGGDRGGAPRVAGLSAVYKGDAS